MNPSPHQIAQLRRKLLAWFCANRRNLPWRRSRDAFRIWIAEIMLQQTRIAAVIPYYGRFLKRFPNVGALARARENEVLRFWAGLGYYSRARNLHRAAKEIVARHGGTFPRESGPALALPGIGSYTAAAILSIAYDAPLAALDGNVARVLARLFAFRGDVREPKDRKKLAAFAQRLLPPSSPGNWNEAMMELGETICTPRAPRCDACPLALSCKAFALGITEELPSPRKRRRPALVRIAAAVLIDRQRRTFLTKRPGAHDAVLFSRMWQFPAVEVAVDANAERELTRHLRDSLGIAVKHLSALPLASHAVTFRKVTLLPYLAPVAKLPRRADSRIASLDRLDRAAVSSATRKIARAALLAIAR